MKRILIFIILLLTFSCSEERKEEARIEKILSNAPDAGSPVYDISDAYEIGLGSYKDSTCIKYAVLNEAPLMSRDETINIIEQAASYWANAVDKPFILVEDYKDANIFFEFVFMDGKGGRLGQADPPPYSKITNWNRPIIIDAYDVNKNATFDPVTIICHELGHGLGLKHSRDPRALMFNIPVDGRRPALDDEMGMRVVYDNKKKFFFEGRSYIAIEDTSKRVSQNFLMSEFYTACNSPRGNFHFLDEDLILAMQMIRSFYDQPIAIISSYRDFMCNISAGGAERSLHQDGQAVDWYFVGPGWRNSYDSFRNEVKNEGVLFQSLVTMGIRGFGAYNTSFHIDTRRSGLKRWNNIQYGTWGRFIEDGYVEDPEHPTGIIH